MTKDEEEGCALIGCGCPLMLGAIALKFAFIAGLIYFTYWLLKS